jgi:hypothetical protein
MQLPASSHLIFFIKLILKIIQPDFSNRILEHEFIYAFFSPG